MYSSKIEGITIDGIIIYLRKSRSDDPILSVEEVLERHEARLQEWALKNFGEKIPEENILREVVSGETINDRPEMLRLLSMIESPKIKAILIIEPQRLSRGDLEDAGRIIKLFRYTNTLICTPNETFDMRDDRDRDYFERELKRGNEFLEYQKRIMNNGRIQSVSQGNYIGSVAPYGYDKIAIKEGNKKCHTLIENKDEADIVRLIFDLYVNQNKGCTTIANMLEDLKVKTRKGNAWNPETIEDILKNVHYIGKVKWNWRKTVKIVEDGEIIKTRPKNQMNEFLVFDGKHDPIISQELFEAAQNRKGKNIPVKARAKVRNPLSGLVFCACGRAMTYRTYTKDGVERSAPRLLCDNQARCKTGSCTYDELQNYVIDVLKQSINDFEIRLKNDDGDSLKLHLKLIASLEKKLEELNKLEISQWEKYSLEAMPKHVFDALNEKVLREKEEIQEALCTAKDSVPDPVDYEEKIARFSDALEAIKDPEVPAILKNRLLKECIDKIIYKREKPERAKGKGAKTKGAYWNSPKIELDIHLRI